MPTSNQIWVDRIAEWNKYYEEWESLFQCVKLEEYYEGKQWMISQEMLPLNAKPYTVNLVYSTIATKMASIILNHPEFDLTPRPGFADWDQEGAIASAVLKEDAINTIIANPNLNFVEELSLAALDHFFRFSVLEVGYAADWQNPNKRPPAMKSDVDEDIAPGDSRDKPTDDFEVPLSEYTYFRWIPARRFRVAVADSHNLKNCAACGYYSYFYTDVLENTQGISFDEIDQEIRNNPTFSPEYRGPSRIVGNAGTDATEDSELEYMIRKNEVTKVWTAWNNKIKKKQLIHDFSGKVIWQDDFEYIPLATHRSIYRLKGWYPVPPVWYWISSQNEINEAREQMRRYRRRFNRKFEALAKKVDTTEIDKMASNVDGEVIIVKERQAIAPIPNPEIGISIEQGLAMGYSDFNMVSGTAQVRESDRETATKSKIISLKEQVRENLERIKFDTFTCEIARLGLLVMSERLTLPLWVKYSIDPSENFLGEVQEHGPGYRLIMAQDLADGYDFNVSIRVVDATNSQTEEDLQRYITFLTLVNQFPQIMYSPGLIRETAYKCGYRNLKVIREMQQAALMQRMAQAALMQNSIQGGQGSQGAQGIPQANANAERSALENAAPNPTNEINQQLYSQV